MSPCMAPCPLPCAHLVKAVEETLVSMHVQRVHIQVMPRHLEGFKHLLEGEVLAVTEDDDLRGGGGGGRGTR